MRKFNLTVKSFNSLQRVEGAKVQRVWATAHKGLYADLGSTKKSLGYKYKSPLDGRPRHIVIERFLNKQKVTQPELDGCIERYCELRALVRNGTDPLQVKADNKQMAKNEAEAVQEADKRETYTLDRAWASYTVHRMFKDDISASTQNRYETCYNKHIYPKLGMKPLHKLNMVVIQQFLDGQENAAHNMATAILMRVQKLAISQGKIEAPFIFGVERRAIGKRERVIDDMPAFLEWLDTDNQKTVKMAIRMQLLTGCRANEIYSLEWAEITDNVIRIPHQRLKTRRIKHDNQKPLLIPVLPKMRAVLDEMRGINEKFVFSHSTDKPVNNGHVHHTLKPFKLSSHDIRRTVATRLFERGCTLEEIDILLDHSIQGVNAHYIVSDNLKTKQAILLKWHVYLDIQASANVLLLKQAI